MDLVVVGLTAADVAELRRKAPTRAHAVLAIDRVVFVGQPVAAVAADEPAIAEEALDLIDVEYAVLPAAIDPLEAMQPGAPPVADAGTEADTSEVLAHGSVAGIATDAKPAKAVSVSQQARLQRGDVPQGFADSDLVLEKTYRVPMIIPMECGGGFGGKIRALCEPITALLARATGRPVRYVMTRSEELEAGMPAPQVIIRLKTGVKRDGTLMAVEAGP